MIALLRTELRRCWSRRAVHLFGALAVAGIVFAAVLIFVNTTTAKDPFDLVDLNDVFRGTSIPLIIMGIALAASFMGAEWSAGTMTTLLTWEPRRLRVFVAKLIAAAIFTFLSAIVLQILLGLALVPVALAHGSTAGANTPWFWTAAGTVTRGAIIATLGAAVGLAIGSLARNTTAAVLGAFFYLFVIENLVDTFKPQWRGWLFGDNAGIFIVGPKPLSESSNVVIVGHSSIQALLAVCAYAVILSAVGIALFLRRDVT